MHAAHDHPLQHLAWIRSRLNMVAPGELFRRKLAWVELPGLVDACSNSFGFPAKRLQVLRDRASHGYVSPEECIHDHTLRRVHLRWRLIVDSSVERFDFDGDGLPEVSPHELHFANHATRRQHDRELHGLSGNLTRIWERQREIASIIAQGRDSKWVGGERPGCPRRT